MKHIEKEFDQNKLMSPDKPRDFFNNAKSQDITAEFGNIKEYRAKYENKQDPMAKHYLTNASNASYRVMHITHRDELKVLDGKELAQKHKQQELERAYFSLQHSKSIGDLEHGKHALSVQTAYKAYSGEVPPLSQAEIEKRQAAAREFASRMSPAKVQQNILSIRAKMKM